MFLQRLLAHRDDLECNETLALAVDLLGEAEEFIESQAGTIEALTDTIRRLTGAALPAAAGTATIGGRTAMDAHVGDPGDTVTVAWKDSNGNPTDDTANLGPLGYASTDDAVVTVDGSGAVAFVGVGTAQVVVTATDQAGNDVPVTPVDVNVLAGPAASGVASIGAPAPAPAP